METVYNFSLPDKKNKEVCLSEYKGKVLLIINTATGCGFTPQYEELEALYKKLKEKGFEILDIPCNQFGHQTPGTDEDVTNFCTTKFGTDFPQFKISDVNGENELPLFTWLKKEKPHGLGKYEDKLAAIMEDLYNKANKVPRNETDIKWNFTKFLVDREGNVVERFEPTYSISEIENKINSII
ncbi:glutathione peroxidase [Prevotella amnii]|jgi:hypothetical protein|uniref:Glutathione peroxidase n=1 Tax=Prevotella amnii TaxID=419005 RepID=A0A134BES1_9BACT|nr:glutathione peroxidase [Prevotella amnii]KXB78442.1 glutathione peroxidase [Prevotella amnii]